MIEVLWHGRGGQGAFTAARLLGAAATLDGSRFALAFPSFGPERRGAPMRAFTKISDAPIGDRTAVTCADIVVYLDGTLFAPGWESELKPGGVCLVNSVECVSDDPRVRSIDANGLAQEVLGRPIPNTVFLGVIAALGGYVERADVEEAIRHYMPAKLHEKNIALVERATALAAGDGGAKSVDSSALGAERLARCATRIDPLCPAVAGRPEGLRIPSLRDDVPGPDVYAENTCYMGGFLTQKNAGWRNVRPVVGADKCTGCYQCYLYCPDGTIFKRAVGEKPAVAVDLDFCKGCGVCSQVCPVSAIDMVNEAEALLAESAATAAVDAAKEADAR